MAEAEAAGDTAAVVEVAAAGTLVVAAVAAACRQAVAVVVAAQPCAAARCAAPGCCCRSVARSRAGCAEHRVAAAAAEASGARCSAAAASGPARMPPKTAARGAKRTLQSCCSSCPPCVFPQGLRENADGNVRPLTARRQQLPLCARKKPRMQPLPTPAIADAALHRRRQSRSAPRVTTLYVQRRPAPSAPCSRKSQIGPPT